MATRIFELARELGVTSKDMLDKCRAEGLDIKNHMAVLSAGLEATIREWFAEGAAQTAVETAEHVDLEKARKKATRQRRKGAKKTDETPAAEAAEVVAEASAPVEEPPAVQAPAVVTEKSPPPALAEPVAEVAPPVAVKSSAVVEPAPAPLPATVTPASQETLPPVPAPVAAEPATPVAKQEPPAPPEPPKVPIKPAGPQLIPRPAKMQGPRVVRVEKPDFIHPPRRRTPIVRPPQQQQPPGGPLPIVPAPSVGGTRKGKLKSAMEEEEEAARAAKKRSPRRRGGRSADSGEGLREWRDQDLIERSARLAAASGGLRRHRATMGHDKNDGTAQAGPHSNSVEIEPPLSVKNLSAVSGIKSGLIIRKLMELGIMANINQIIDQVTAETIMTDLGVELHVRGAKSAEDMVIEQLTKRQQGEVELRAPVVTFLGHVDHGKTSLLDRIRNATVATGEAGGITQHIGAYRYDIGGSHVVFLDTPGHEAFTAMRARGANMTDVVVLVVAADDGVMPQTIEALSHAKAAKVPIVVALNKIDVPNANETRVLGQLSEHGLQPREWGGNVEVIRTSAHTGQGIDTLIETLSLEAEILELKAEKGAPASGFVIEAEMSSGFGVLAKMLVRDGTLRVGDILLAGRAYGRVRQMLDDKGRAIDEAGPSTPVQVAGLDEMPAAGDKFYVVETLEKARDVVAERRQTAREADLATIPARTLEGMLSRIEAGQAKELAIILKADVQGSLEAIVGSINKINTAETRLNILHTAVGGITTGDVSLAEASDAIIIGFNAVPDAAARQMAEAKGVDIRLYRIIYDILEDIRKAVEEGLAPEIRMETLGRAEVRQTFKVSRVGTIAGCFVIEGVANRNAKVRITRNNIVVEDERSLESLKRFKDDAREVKAGMECGLKIAGYDDIKEGDILEFYHRIEIARKL